MNSLDHTVAEIDNQSFWTNLIVNKSYSTSLLISLFMIPVIHSSSFFGKTFRSDAIASPFADFVIIGNRQAYCIK